MKLSFTALWIAALLLTQGGDETTLSGRITDALTHQPIAGANIVCAGGRATTDENGAYSLHVRPGFPIGIIAIMKKGYPELPFAIGKPPIRIAPGTSVTRDFELMLSAVISGHLLDRDTGKPIAGFAITARGGNATWTGPPSGSDGGFRFNDLKPGDYTIEIDPPLANSSAVGYGRSWYPGVPREEMALAVTLTAGEIRNLEVRLQKRELHHLAGLIDLPGATDDDPITIRVTAGKWPVRSIAEGQISKAGAFHIDGLSEGTYVLSATTKTRIASRKIELPDRDIDDMKIVMRPYIAVRAELRMAEDKAAVPENVALALRPFLPSPFAPLFKHLEEIPPGEYWPVLALPKGYAVTSVTFNGRPIVNTTIVLEEPESTVSFVITSRPSGLAGIVRDANQNPVPGASITLLPESLPDSGDRVDEMARRVATADANGAYRFSGLAPGKYKVGALNASDTVSLDFGQTASLDLVIK